MVQYGDCRHRMAPSSCSSRMCCMSSTASSRLRPWPPRTYSSTTALLVSFALLSLFTHIPQVDAGDPVGHLPGATQIVAFDAGGMPLRPVVHAA